MKKMNRGVTLVELIVAVSLLVLVCGIAMAALLLIQRLNRDGAALARSQATARIVVAKVVRSLRHGQSFSIPSSGDQLTITKYDDSTVTFTFDNGDGNDDSFIDNVIREDGMIIGRRVVKLPGQNIFTADPLDSYNNTVAVNFGARNAGTVGDVKEVRISTKACMRN